jgi:alpha-glucan,water dikinase
MAVLIQEVVEAEYAFVLHTANPITSDRSEIFGEIVLGLGETLVGNHPGSALGFVCSKRNGSIKILSYPGKSFGLYGSGLIFRSDSNGEDLEDFAGAGLYDSVLGRHPEQRRLDYSAERLLWNKDFRNGLIEKIARIGIETEKLFDAPQDIEGAVTSQDRHYVVQTRPQVGLK